MTSGLAVTSAVLAWTAAALKRGDPAWWKSVAKAWEKRNFTAWGEAWGLYLAALHFAALSDANSPLVAYFPSCGGTAEAEPGPGLAEFFSAPPSSFLENLRARHRRAYVAPRSSLWVAPALLFFQRRGLPFYLMEVDAGAGLNLAADAVLEQKVFDSSLVAARIGLDPQPLDLSDIEHRRWLTAGVHPDDAAAILALDRAVEIVQKRILNEGNFIQLVPCAAAKAAAFAAKNIPADDPDVGLLLFNMGATSRMTDAEYRAYGESMSGLLRPWGDRGLWIEVESVRGEAFSTTHQLRAHRVVDGRLRSLVMASVDLATSRQAYDAAAGEAFLA